jgi:hypothetical protein
MTTAPALDGIHHLNNPVRDHPPTVPGTRNGSASR